MRLPQVSTCTSIVTDNHALIGAGGRLAADGAYLYVLTGNGLYRLGSGLQETIFGMQYARNTQVHCHKIDRMCNAHADNVRGWCKH